MKSTRPLLSLSLGLCVLALPHVAHAQTQTPNAPILRRQDGRPDGLQRAWATIIVPANLAAKLRTIIGPKYPDVKIEAGHWSVSAVHRSDRYETHLLDSKNEISTDEPNKFPPEFDEFWLQVNVNSAPQTVGVAPVWDVRPESFGTTLMGKMNLVPPPFFDVKVGGESSAYTAYDTLTGAGLATPFDRGPRRFSPNTMSRRQFAEATIQARSEIDARKKAGTPLPSATAIAALADLEKAFAVEIDTLTGKLDPRKPVAYTASVTVRFSYGQGVDKQLIEDIKRVFSTEAITPPFKP